MVTVAFRCNSIKPALFRRCCCVQDKGRFLNVTPRIRSSDDALGYGSHPGELRPPPIKGIIHPHP